jgi:hypothetical protein
MKILDRANYVLSHSTNKRENKEKINKIAIFPTTGREIFNFHYFVAGFEIKTDENAYRIVNSVLR